MVSIADPSMSAAGWAAKQSLVAQPTPRRRVGSETPRPRNPSVSIRPVRHAAGVWAAQLAVRQDVGQQLDRAVELDVTARLGAYAPLLQRVGEPGTREGGTNHLVRDADGRRGPPVGEIGIGRDDPVPRPGRLVARPHPARDPAILLGVVQVEGAEHARHPWPRRSHWKLSWMAHSQRLPRGRRISAAHRGL